MSKIRRSFVTAAVVAMAATGSLVAGPSQAHAASMTPSEAKECARGTIYCSMYYARGTDYTVAKYGTSNRKVYNLQKSLITLGFGISKPTSYYGSETKKAVLGYQISRKLRQTGVFDYSTQHALRVGAGGSVPTGYGRTTTNTTNGYSGSCIASHYWEPQPTASGEWFNPWAMTAAHKTMPFGTKLKVTNKANGKSVVVRINDRGPYITGRCLDLSKGAFLQISPESAGIANVTYQQVS